MLNEYAIYALSIVSISAFVSCFLWLYKLWLYKLADLRSKFELLERKVHVLDYQLKYHTKVCKHEKFNFHEKIHVNDEYIFKMMSRKGEQKVKVDDLSNIFRIAKSESGKFRVLYNKDSGFIPFDPSRIYYYRDNNSVATSLNIRNKPFEKEWYFLSDDCYEYDYAQGLTFHNKFFKDFESCVAFIEELYLKVESIKLEEENKNKNKEEDENVVEIIDFLKIDENRHQIGFTEVYKMENRKEHV